MAEDLANVGARLEHSITLPHHQAEFYDEGPSAAIASKRGDALVIPLDLLGEREGVVKASARRYAHV
jgi:hypothetical protein